MTWWWSTLLVSRLVNLSSCHCLSGRSLAAIHSIVDDILFSEREPCCWQINHFPLPSHFNLNVRLLSTPQMIDSCLRGPAFGAVCLRSAPRLISHQNVPTYGHLAPPLPLYVSTRTPEFEFVPDAPGGEIMRFHFQVLSRPYSGQLWWLNGKVWVQRGNTSV